MIISVDYHPAISKASLRHLMASQKELKAYLLKLTRVTAAHTWVPNKNVDNDTVLGMRCHHG